MATAEMIGRGTSMGRETSRTETTIGREVARGEPAPGGAASGAWENVGGNERLLSLDWLDPGASGPRPIA